jgi:tRNA threonylcarbamoyladenosine biosynthesis protein TsaB
VIRIALETATPVGTVAVGRGDRVLAEVGLGVQTRHAESLVPALAMALELAGIDRAEVHEVVVGAGPGSFTGVRVAAATAKGLVAALGLPLLAYPSLLALAAGVPSDRPVCALLDARRGEVYAGCWRVGAAGIETVLAPMVGPIADVVDATRTVSPLFVGDGAIRYRDALLTALGGASATPVSAAVLAAPAIPAHPRASVLLWLAEHHPDGARVGDVAGWQPSYVRGSSAERGIAG